MILYYEFEIMCEVECDTLSHINNEWFEPHYRSELCEVDYEFDVDITFEDFFDYMEPYAFHDWKEDEKNAYERACRDVFESDWFNLDNLEEDEDFIEFMKIKYEDKALKKCKREYE